LESAAPEQVEAYLPTPVVFVTLVEQVGGVAGAVAPFSSPV
jgi:flavin reductase (DIM6/NTAB) family NADH-FMN oxidoreductase RutF